MLYLLVGSRLRQSPSSVGSKEDDEGSSGGDSDCCITHIDYDVAPGIGWGAAAAIKQEGEEEEEEVQVVEDNVQSKEPEKPSNEVEEEADDDGDSELEIDDGDEEVEEAGEGAIQEAEPPRPPSLLRRSLRHKK